MSKPVAFSTALMPLSTALASKWDQIKLLRKMLATTPLPEDDATNYLKIRDAIETEYIFILLTAHAACEALINCTLAIALTDAGKSEVFSMCEKADFLDKWENGPKIVLPSYSLDKSTAIYETLKRMNTHRNSYLHNKAHLSVGGELIFEGSKLVHTSFESDIDWIHRYISLPFDLGDHLRKYNELLVPAITLRRGAIKRAPQHQP